MWMLLFGFVLIDGMVSRNPQPWAAPIRAGLVAALFVISLMMIRRARVRLPIGAAIISGILAALVVSDVYQRVSFGLSTWVIYAGAYALQRASKSDWSKDFSIAGVLVTGLAWVILIGTLDGIEKPATLWHRNELGGILAVLLPAATTLPGRQRWIISAFIVAGVLMTTSRGAILGAAVGMAVIVQPWALVAAPALAAGLALLMRQEAAVMRLVYFSQAIELLRSSIMWGVGPGLQMPEEGIHAHNTLLTLVTQIGAVGVAIIGSALTVMRRVHFERWQLATLAVVATHSLVDDPMCWWPVGVIIGLVLASENATCQRAESV